MKSWIEEAVVRHAFSIAEEHQSAVYVVQEQKQRAIGSYQQLFIRNDFQEARTLYTWHSLVAIFQLEDLHKSEGGDNMHP